MTVTHWDDKCYVTITKSGGSDTEYRCKTRDITVGGGEAGIEVLNVNCGQLTKRSRPEAFTIGFTDIVMLEASDWRQLKEGGTDAAQPIEVTSGTSRDQFRIALLWTNQTGVTSATNQAITGTNQAYRVVMKDCYFNSMEETWTDQLLAGSAEFSVAAQDATASGNVLWQSKDAAAGTMSTLSAYTGGNFGN